MKTYPIQEVMAFLFSMSQSQTNEWIHRLAKILQKALAELNYLPERDATNLADSLKGSSSQKVQVGIRFPAGL
jgi:hypothetical protein